MSGMRIAMVARHVPTRKCLAYMDPDDACFSNQPPLSMTRVRLFRPPITSSLFVVIPLSLRPLFNSLAFGDFVILAALIKISETHSSINQLVCVQYSRTHD